MTAYEKYRKRLELTSGSTTVRRTQDATRSQWLSKTANWINRKLPNSLSYFDCKIDGQERVCGIVSSNNINEKRIMSMPGETLRAGAYVVWMDNYWLITELDAVYELYQAATMVQCNYLLKWVNDKGQIVSRWVYAEDGTKYMTGEYYQTQMTVGDGRYQVTMPRDSETVKIERGDRFLIDDPDAVDTSAFEVTKANRASYTYQDTNEGVFILMMVESNFQHDDDNTELMIANYYSRIGKVYIDVKNIGDAVTLAEGTELQIEATVTVGGESSDEAELTYASSDEQVATVDETGLITAVATGTCTITVSYGEQNVEFEVSVVTEDDYDADVASLNLALSNGYEEIYVGTSIEVTAVTYLADTEAEEYSYECSLDCDDSVATVSLEDNIVTVATVRNRGNVGTVITLTVTDTVNDVSAAQEFTIRGWV